MSCLLTYLFRQVLLFVARMALLTQHADHAEATLSYGTDDEEHSVLEDDSEAEDGEEYIEEDDMSSTLSIPNESIDFDMVYAFHSFAATVEGQANVVKGDSLYLMDDTNSYWWLVRVLKTQEVGYIPAENIETPFERLARLNKHRNIDVSITTLTVFISILKPSQACLTYPRRTDKPKCASRKYDSSDWPSNPFPSSSERDRESGKSGSQRSFYLRSLSSSLYSPSS